MKSVDSGQSLTNKSLRCKPPLRRRGVEARPNCLHKLSTSKLTAERFEGYEVLQDQIDVRIIVRNEVSVSSIDHRFFCRRR